MPSYCFRTRESMTVLQQSGPEGFNGRIALIDETNIIQVCSGQKLVISAKLVPFEQLWNKFAATRFLSLSLFTPVQK